jgi:hypothetical protein
MDTATPGFSPDGEIALANAAINNAANPTSCEFAAAVGAVPSNLTAPSSVVLAACLLNIEALEAFLITMFTLQYTISGSGQIQILVRYVTGATSIQGGVQSGNWLVENGGTPVTITGGAAAVTVATLTETATVANSKVLSWNAPGAAAQGKTAFELVVTSAVNITAMQFSAVFAEY